MFLRTRLMFKRIFITCCLINVVWSGFAVHAQVKLDLSDESVKPGEKSEVEIILDSDGQSVAALATDIEYNTLYLSNPEVVINPNISEGTNTDRQVVRGIIESGRFRIGLIPASYTETSLNAIIPDGIVATVSFDVDSTAPTDSILLLVNNPSACNPQGHRLTTIGENGSITIQTGLGIIDTKIPTQYNLHQNYPNPFNSSTIIEYEIPVNHHVYIGIYNLRGEHVSTLVNQFENAGYKEIIWNGKNEAGDTIPSGIFFYMIRAGDYQECRKIIIMK